jgi:hypothetical protein
MAQDLVLHWRRTARSVEDVVQPSAIRCRVFTSTPFDQVEVQVEASRNAVCCCCLDDNTVHHFPAVYAGDSQAQLRPSMRLRS